MDYRDPGLRRSPPMDPRRGGGGGGGQAPPDFRSDSYRPPPPGDWTREREFGQTRDFGGSPPQQVPIRNGGDRVRGQAEFIPSQYSPDDYGKRMDNKWRSRSLDLREAFHDDYDSPRGGSGRKERNYDYDRDDWANKFGSGRPKDDFYSRERPVDIGRPREIEIPMKRIPRAVAKSQELTPYGRDRDRDFDTYRHQRHSPRDDFSRDFGRDPRDLDNVKYSREARATLNRSAGYSPKSIASSRPPPDFGGSANRYSTHRTGDAYRDGYRDRDYYREEARGSATVGDTSRGGHYKASKHQSSYHHESHGSGGQQSASAGGFFGIPRKVINQQPGTGGGGGAGGRSGYYHHEYYSSGGRPIQQHRQVNCCCFRWVWPPWSVEPVPPPQQIYKNI